LPDYNIFITDADGNKYTYTPTTVTVYKPKRESDGSIIDANYDISVTGAVGINYNNNSGDSFSFNIYANTYYLITVDVNSGFFERKWNISVSSGTYYLYPYLVAATEGTSTTIRVLSPVNQAAVSDVEIRLYRYFDGVGRINVETVLTDDKGEALISGVTNYTYEAELWYDNVEAGSFDITVTSTLWVITFNPASLPTLPEGAIVSVNFSPSSGSLDQNTLTLSQSIYMLNASISSVVVFFNDGNVDANLHVDTTLTPSASFTNSATIATTLAGWDINHTLTVTVQILFTDGNVLTRKTTYTKYDATKRANEYLDLLKYGIRGELGCPANSSQPCGMLIMISCFITMLACGALIAATPLRDPAGISGMGALIMGFFVFLEWIPLFWYVLICVILFGFIIAKWRVES
jgi:hypothetical protein